MVFNRRTMTDAERIEALGGPAKVADALGYDKASGGVQRVHNWKARGIPAKVKLQWPAMFLAPDLISPAPAPTTLEASHAG